MTYEDAIKLEDDREALERLARAANTATISIGRLGLSMGRAGLDGEHGEEEE